MDDTDSTAIDARTVPPDLAEAMQTAFGLDEPPDTVADWLGSASRLLDDSEIDVGVGDLCTADESRHVARIDGESQHFRCVLDALVLPFLLPGESPVEVRSQSPVSDEPVELAVSRDAVEVTPTGAVMSFGFAEGLEAADPGDVEPGRAYEAVCPYVNAFPSREEYDRWARETGEASTMALSFPAGLELAEALADVSAD